ncbi:MAG: hypothetical protein HFE44_17005 [Oscillospiraceae bacterium]|jgi:uncharacterized protein YaaR (DUF327 family)|nr:hypothetical protein [Oscillospiraceae bacterium]
MDKVKKITDSLDITVYKLNAFAEVIRDIIDDMPNNEKDDSYPVLCCMFCRNVQNKLDVLTSQLMTESEKSINLVSELEREVF